MNTNEYMLQLHNRLLAKTYGNPPRNVGENTANAYIKVLYNLNDKEPFKNLAFLKKTDEVMKKIGEYAESTQKTLLASITSVLSLEKDTTGYKKTYKFYFDKMAEKSEKAKEVDTSEKTTKQEANWLDWDKVIEKYNNTKKEVLNVKKPSMEALLPLVVLSLYTEIPPRRNQDYLHLRVHKATPKENTDSLDKEHNYLVIRKRKPEVFIFNKYKTFKTYGTQKVPIPESLQGIITLYLKQHPLAKEKEYPFLVLPDGAPITADNAITRILNKIFGKNVGSSMLRHIYLSGKYDINSMVSDSEAMGHSLNQQREYLKGAPPEVSPVPPEPSSSEPQ